MSSMTVLGLDSAMTGCSVALIEKGRLKAERCRPDERGQAEILIPMIEETMAASGSGFAELDLIAVTVGPGAFTGLRIGLAAARGLALAAKCPLAGVTTLEAVARATDSVERAGRRLVVALETKRRDLYLQCFGQDLAPEGAPAAVEPSDFARWMPTAPLLLVGDGAPRLEESLRGRDVRLSAAAGLPAARLVAEIALGRHGTAAARAADPLYLRPPDVTMPRTAPR